MATLSESCCTFKLWHESKEGMANKENIFSYKVSHTTDRNHSSGFSGEETVSKKYFKENLSICEFFFFPFLVGGSLENLPRH